MKRQRLTQMFPALLPLRLWQKKQCFYLSMALDHHHYAKNKSRQLLPYTIYSDSSLMLNTRSGCDISYQLNKIHNLKLAARCINHLIINPGDTFSFWQLVKDAERYGEFKDGLAIIDGKTQVIHGGGLCQISNLLHWVFLHSPLTVIERHGHQIESFPSPDHNLPYGVDATVNEGWLDLKVRNDTTMTFQINIHFDGTYIFATLYANEPLDCQYHIFNASVDYVEQQGHLYRLASVERTISDHISSVTSHLYINRCEITYPLTTINHQIKEGYNYEHC